MEQRPKFRCKLIRHPHLEKFEVQFPGRFTDDPHKFGAVVGRVERELGLKGKISRGDGRYWTMPDDWFYQMPTTERIVEVVRETFSICLSTDLEVEVIELDPAPVPDPVLLGEQGGDRDEPLVDGLALSPGDLP